MRTLPLAAVLALAACAGPSAAPAGRPPNVVVIFIDDMAYADVGPFGAKAFPTPNLDRLAREGRVLTDFYVAQAVCSASRAALLTGCYNVRVSILGALGPASPTGISADETTLAELCRSRGYATACFGKWHLGHHRKFLPLQHGFDEYLGLPYSNDMWPRHPDVAHLPEAERVKRWPPLPLIEGNETVKADVGPEDQELLTGTYTERAVAFIERNRAKPFFLYVPHGMVHVPLHVSDRFRGKSGAGLFGDVVMEVDDSVGRIVDAIRRQGLEKDTVLLFTSDNGPWLSYGAHAGSAGPLREGKGTSFEGGVRVPAIAWAPGRIPAGTACREPAMTIDVLPTVARLIGAPLPPLPIDGKDVWPLLAGEPGATSPHEAYAFYWGRKLEAVRGGRWKLHFPHEYRTLGGRPGGTDGRPAKYDAGRTDLALYDLEADPGEKVDVKAKHPDVVARLEAFAARTREELGDGDRAGRGVRPAGTVAAR
jgi:arylsulfatase A-like enzyme